MLVWPLLSRIGLEMLLTIKVGKCRLDARNGAVLVEGAQDRFCEEKNPMLPKERYERYVHTAVTRGQITRVRALDSDYVHNVARCRFEKQIQNRCDQAEAAPGMSDSMQHLEYHAGVTEVTVRFLS
jgi:hypothetical protein